MLSFFIYPEGEEGTRNMPRQSQHEEIITEPEKLLTVREAYEMLRISKWTLYQLLHRRELESVQIGRRRLIPMSSVTKLIEKLKTDAYEAYY